MCDTQVMQGTSNLHHLIRCALFSMAQHILDNTAALDPSNTVLYLHAHPGQNPVEQLLAHAQGFALRLFFGWLVNTPVGS